MLSSLALTANAKAADTATESGINEEKIVRKGVFVDFKATPAAGFSQLLEGGFADIEFRITSAEDDEPLRGVYPGVWIDLTEMPDGEESGVGFDCRTRVTQYMQGLVGMRPMIDLNSYYVMVLNRDPSISVIDPVVGITGITSLYANIDLKRPGADWTKTSDEKTMFVSMPRAGEVAVINLDTFKVTRNVATGEMPTRIALQPDQKYVWVGNNAERGNDGGVTVLDAASGDVVASITTGTGHHEITFSGDSRSAFVTNRDSGTVSVIDIGSLEKISDIGTGRMPISIAYSPLSEFVYVADGQVGEITVFDAQSREIIRRIAVEAGLGPMRFSQDGRWGFVVNPVEDRVFVVDATSNELAHAIDIEGRPFQVHVSRTFAYIRALDTEQVRMINLQELDRNGQVIINNFAAGQFPPSKAAEVSIADTLAPAAQEAAMLVASPGDATVYYYMEGMNAPMGAFRNYGHQPRAVQIANRALQEKEPGLYSATVKLPVAGTFEVAFLNETPEFLHCFTMEAAVNPAIERAVERVAIDYLTDKRNVTAGEDLDLRFRLIDPRSGEPREGLKDVMIKYYRAPRFDLTQLTAAHVADGIYEAQLPMRSPGGYYIFVSAPSLKLGYNDLNYLTVMASKPALDKAADTVDNP
jgi:YVTN family beta-propeller protein